MTRLIACTAAAALALAGFAALRIDVPPVRSPAPELTAAVASERAETAMPAGATVGAHAARRPVDGAAVGRSSADGLEISFASPRDFATGAQPSASGAFNRAAGEQLGGFTNTHATVSDGIAVGDFNRDGNADVVQTNALAGSLSIFIGTGDGGFAAPALLTVGAEPRFVLAGHLDLDDSLDLAVADLASNDVAILRGRGDGSFDLPEFVPVPAPRTVAIGDVNHDGVPDIAVASGAMYATQAGGVAIFTGIAGSDGRVTFVPAQFVALRNSSGQPIGANAVVVGDFDGGGPDDVAVTIGLSPNAGDRQAGTDELTGDDLLVFLNRNDGGVQPLADAPAQVFRVGAMPQGVAIGDWNGDARTDLAVVGTSSGDVTSLIGDGNGRFDVKEVNRTVSFFPRTLASADLDGDGVLDLVAPSFYSSTLGVLRGRGDGTFDPSVDFWAGNASTAAATGDFDGDGRLDVVVARLRTDQMTLLRNDGPRPTDGVAITRDIPYISAPDDPFARHHTLDVYEPPDGTPSFAGAGKPYPVLIWAHGGAWITGDKNTSYLLRSLAREGIVTVSTNYRLGPPTGAAAAADDVAQAFRWVRDNVRSRFGGDPANIVVFGHSAGSDLWAAVASNAAHADVVDSMRGMVLSGAPTAVARFAPGYPTPVGGTSSAWPASLLVSGTDGVEHATALTQEAFCAASSSRGIESTCIVVNDRDHLTLIANLALPDDPGRAALLSFIRSRVAPS